MLPYKVVWLSMLYMAFSHEIEGSIFSSERCAPKVNKIKGYYENELTITDNNVETETKIKQSIKWMYQKLDHFNNSDERIWKMRYFENDFLPTGGEGPFFVQIGSESINSEYHTVYGHFRDLAQKYNAYHIVVEHRFYGASQPFTDLSTPNLQYLHSKQAVADIAHLIETLKHYIAGITHSKVIVCGGSYAGRLAIQLKSFYPQHVDGVWASSAPLFALSEFSEIRGHFGNPIFKIVGQNCSERIQNGISKIQNSIELSSNVNEIKMHFNLCENNLKNNTKDFWMFYLAILKSFDQFDSENDVKLACDTIMESNDDIIGLGQYFKSKFENHENCFKLSYEDSIEILKNINNFNSSRQWFYQTCNEFGWFPVSDPNRAFFGQHFPWDLFSTMCRDVFGNFFSDYNINYNIIDTNLYFGNHLNLTNVHMTVGEYDPWRFLVQIPTYNASLLTGGFYCSDFDPADPMDSPVMKMSKNKIDQLIEKWVK